MLEGSCGLLGIGTDSSADVPYLARQKNSCFSLFAGKPIKEQVINPLMESLKPPMPDISDRERSALVDTLFEMIAWRQKQIDELEQQILKLKGKTTKPRIKPSTMDKETDSDNNKEY